MKSYLFSAFITLLFVVHAEAKLGSSSQQKAKIILKKPTDEDVANIGKEVGKFIKHNQKRRGLGKTDKNSKKLRKSTEKDIANIRKEVEKYFRNDQKGRKLEGEMDGSASKQGSIFDNFWDDDYYWNDSKDDDNNMRDDDWNEKWDDDENSWGDDYGGEGDESESGSEFQWVVGFLDFLTSMDWSQVISIASSIFTFLQPIISQVIQINPSG